MKRLSVVILLCSVTFLFIGCQVTPVKESSSSSENAAAEIEIPESYDLNVEKNNVTLKINANVDASANVKNSYIMTTKLFSQEEVDSLIAELIGDGKIYDYSLLDPSNMYTKEEIQQIILEYGAMIATEQDESKKQRLTDLKQNYENMLKNAPEKREMVELDGKLQVLKDKSDEVSVLDAVTDKMEDGLYYRFYIKDNSLYFKKMDTLDSANIYDLNYARASSEESNISNTTFDEAEALANNFLEGYLDEHMVLVESGIVPNVMPSNDLEFLDVKDEAYYFKYSGRLDDMIIDNEEILINYNSSHVDVDQLVEDMGDLPYAPTRENLFFTEELTVFVTGDGIDCVEWRNRSSLLGIEEEGINILGFDEAMEEAQKHFFHSRLATKEDPYSLDVKDIKLVYTKVMKKNDMDNCLVVPAWVFVGREVYEEVNNMNETRRIVTPDKAPDEYKYYLDIDPYDEETMFDVPVFKISAIDGKQLLQ